MLQSEAGPQLKGSPCQWTPKWTLGLIALLWIHRRGRTGQHSTTAKVVAAAQAYDYDLVIIGCGVGGHGAALHAVESVSLARNADHEA